MMRCVLFCGASLVTLVAGLWAAPEVSPVSPFLPPDQPVATAAVTENAPIEFRGVFVIGSRQKFGFFDPSRRLSVWVGMNDGGSDYRVTRFDADTDTVHVDVGGRALILTLQKVKIASAPMPANLPAAPVAFTNQVPGAATAPAPVVLNPTPADEAKRLEAIAAEVRRRRALRQQVPTPIEKSM